MFWLWILCGSIQTGRIAFSVKTERLPETENGREIRRSRKAEPKERIKAEDLETGSQVT